MSPKGDLYTTSIRLHPTTGAWLTQTAAQILTTSGTRLDKSLLLRGLVAGCAAAGLDLSICTDEGAIMRAVAQRLTAKGTVDRRVAIKGG